MRLLFPIHDPVFGCPHNQVLRLAGLDVISMPLHRLRATTSPRAQADLLTRSRTEVRALRRRIRERAIDLVQVAGLVNPHAALAARAEGLPVVWQMVDGRAPAALRRMRTSVASRLADVLMFTGQRIAELHTDGVLPHQPSMVFYPPVDPDVFRPRPELRAQS
jgi:hypothetical protein